MKIRKTRTRGEYYVYVYLDPRKSGKYVYGDHSFDHEPIYVGKGKRKRAYYFEGHNKFLKAKLTKFGSPAIKIIAEQLLEFRSFELEKILIALIGRKDQNRGTLCNLTDGGEGVSGCIRSEESKQKLRDLPPKSEETRRKLSMATKGKKKPRRSEATKKTPWSEERKQNHSKATKGKKKIPWSEERKQQASKDRKGRKQTSGDREGKPAWNKGIKSGKPPWNKDKKMSQEFCRKVSEALKGKPSPHRGKKRKKPAWNKDKKWPEEIKRKIGEGVKNRNQIKQKEEENEKNR